MDRRVVTWRLEVSEERANGVTVLVVTGRLGFETVQALQSALSRVDLDGPGLVIDLAGVDYISSAGLKALDDHIRVAKGSVAICGARDAVRLTLELSGLLTRVTLSPTRDDAIASFGRPGAPHGTLAKRPADADN
jgi:anti-anti-sigma factor